MKKNLFVASAFILSSCLSEKTITEFEAKKPEVLIVFSPAQQVEKKTGFTILFPEYMNNAPPDTQLLKIFNQYLMYQLDELGYKALIVKDASYSKELIKNSPLAWDICLQVLKLNEFKKREEVSDGKTSKTVKMRGLEVSASASVRYIPDTIGTKGMECIASGSASREESQEGQFKQTVGIKDLVKGNNSGSTKYLYNINHLEDGVFQNLLIDAAARMASDIDLSIKKIYKRKRKAEEKTTKKKKQS
jgi:hypothetical protein